MQNYNHSKHAVYNLNYHIIFCPKYRKPYLLKYEKDLIICLKQKASEIDCTIENIEIMPDHLHLFLKCNCKHIAPSKLVQYLKGYSSYYIRKKYSYLKKFKAFWSDGYYIESIGNISKKTIKKYIDQQKINIKANYRYKKMIQ